MTRTRAMAAGGLVGLLAVAGAFGMVGPANAIVGGTPSSPLDYPYFAKVFSPAGFCGGSIVADSWVLTAAHCVADAGSPAQITVVVTGHGSQVATESHVHPLWNGDATAGHDVALLRLGPGATTGITPVQLGAPYDPGAYAGDNVSTIMGYGRTGANEPDSPVLLAADTPLRSDQHMRDQFPWYATMWIDDLMIGAGSTGQTTCFGDSGGPLVVNRNGHAVQVGVTSFEFHGPTEADCTRPSAFAEVSGPQLAWLATVAPAAMAGWGSCTDSNGWIGQPVTSYTTNYVFPGNQDGPYYWGFGCVNGQPPPTPMGTVPYLIGLRQSEATTAIQQAGLTVGSVILGVDRTCNHLGEVMSQSPQAGTVVPAGSAVSITVGKKPPVCK